MQTISPESKLDNLAFDASTEGGEGGFMDPKKKKRGRPPKGNAKPSQSENVASSGPIRLTPEDQVQKRIQSNQQFLSGCLGFLDDALYPLHETPEARLKGEQKELIVTNGAICMEQYLPDMLNKHMPLILMSFGLGGYGFGIYNARQRKLKEMDKRVRAQETRENVRPLNTEITQ